MLKNNGAFFGLLTVFNPTTWYSFAFSEKQKLTLPSPPFLARFFVTTGFVSDKMRNFVETWKSKPPMVTISSHIPGTKNWGYW